MMNSAQQPDNGGWLAAGALVGLILLIVGISQCSSPDGDAAGDAANLMNENVSAAIAAQSPAPVEPLNRASVDRGVAHLRVAVGAEGFPGAMIYSQNCYDALSRQFSWAKLDVCGAFDMLAVRSTPDTETSGLDNETRYFESETAAGRYLAAATGAGEDVAKADTRLSQLQSRVARLPSVARHPAPAKSDAAETNTSNVESGSEDWIDNIVGESANALEADE
jgi:hypothetical protein